MLGVAARARDRASSQMYSSEKPGVLILTQRPVTGPVACGWSLSYWYAPQASSQRSKHQCGIKTGFF